MTVFVYSPLRRRRGSWRRLLPVRVGRTTGSTRRLWYLRIGPLMWVFS